MKATAKDRIIVAIDVDEPGKAVDLVERLAPHVGAFKLGFEFFTATLIRLATSAWEPALTELNTLQRLFTLLGVNVFWDGKFLDIPNTVAGASKQVASLGLLMFDVHCTGGPKMMRKAREAADEMAKTSPTGTRSLVFGVTLLTSLDYDDLVLMGVMPPLDDAKTKDLEQKVKANRIRSYVRKLALLARESGLDGVIASPQEIKAIRDACGPAFKIATPGVRPAGADAGDQKRVMTPGEAIRVGADYLVIGRPIRNAPDPVEAAQRIAEEIDQVLATTEVA